jgi:hypothetical protein
MVPGGHLRRRGNIQWRELSKGMVNATKHDGIALVGNIEHERRKGTADAEVRNEESSERQGT